MHKMTDKTWFSRKQKQFFLLQKIFLTWKECQNMLKDHTWDSSLNFITDIQSSFILFIFIFSPVTISWADTLLFLTHQHFHGFCSNFPYFTVGFCSNPFRGLKESCCHKRGLLTFSHDHVPVNISCPFLEIISTTVAVGIPGTTT